jgi:hypothetical protein
MIVCLEGWACSWSVFTQRGEPCPRAYDAPALGSDERMSDARRGTALRLLAGPGSHEPVTYPR